MNNENLAIILEYCWRLSRMVSPYDAQNYYGMNHDSSVSDFLSDLSLAMKNNVTLDIENDEFYSEVFNRIRENLKEHD